MHIHEGITGTLQDMRKFVPNYEELVRRIAELRSEGNTIVLTQGTFDLVHIGHGRYLMAAKNCGNVLVVGVDSDKKTKKRKGPGRPLVPEAERIEMLIHTDHADLVVLKEDNGERWSLIKLVRPDVLIATETTYTPEQVDQLQEFCGEVVVLRRQAETSTSARIRMMQIEGATSLARRLAPKIERLIQEESEAMKRGA